jgi:TonB family protein
VGWAHIAILLVIASVAGCATRPPGPTRSPPEAVATDPHDGPPIGTGRLPSSLACEPEPPLPCGAECVTATGEAARHIGSLDKEVIRAVVRAHLDEVRECYDAIGLTQPSARGRLAIKFGISPSGAVQTSCLVSSDLGAPPVDACVLERVLNWRFPAPEGGGWVIVTYPFTFERPAH